MSEVLRPDGPATRENVAAALRQLAELTVDGRRSIAVLGELDADPGSLGDEHEAREEHDAIGRLVVRLNIGQLVAVGHGARHIQAAAGLEGSWDGESLAVATPDEAYDLLRGLLRENDVVLVMASERVGLAGLVDRLRGVTR